MSDRDHFVYTAFDEHGRVLYVGCTAAPERRIKEHLAGGGDARGWFDSFVARWRMSGPYERATALRIEKQMQRALEPVWNGHDPRNNRCRRELITEYVASHGLRFVEGDRRARLVPIEATA